MSSPPKSSHRRHRHSRKYASSSFDTQPASGGPAASPSTEPIIAPGETWRREKVVGERREKKKPPKITDLLGDYFVTGGRAGESTRAELSAVVRENVERESAMPRRQRAGDTIFQEPSRSSTRRSDGLYGPESEAERRRTTALREEEGRMRYHEADPRLFEQDLRQRDEDNRKSQSDLRRHETARERYEADLSRREWESRAYEAGPQDRRRKTSIVVDELRPRAWESSAYEADTRRRKMEAQSYEVGREPLPRQGRDYEVIIGGDEPESGPGSIRGGPSAPAPDTRSRTQPPRDRYDAAERRTPDARPRSRSRSRESLERFRDAGRPARVIHHRVIHHTVIRHQQDARSASKTRSRQGSQGGSGAPNDDGSPGPSSPRLRLRGGGGPDPTPSLDISSPKRASTRIVEDEPDPDDLIRIFYVRYGEIREISPGVSPGRLGGIGRWSDKKLLRHLVEGYRRQSGTANWLTWRYWWDLFMKEIAALVLIQMEHSMVSYRRTADHDHRRQPPFTSPRRRARQSIDLFGGKEASGQFRYLIHHHRTMSDTSRIMTSQIDSLAIWGQLAQAETEGYTYYLLLQIVEGQNGRAFLLGIFIIIVCFLAFGLALGATQASGLSWGDAFSISGFGLASLSGLFALMALSQYFGMEDMNPGNPISRGSGTFNDHGRGN